jgi:heme oxygenase
MMGTSTSATTSATNAQTETHCPYAVALHHNDDSSEYSGESESDESEHPEEILVVTEEKASTTTATTTSGATAELQEERPSLAQALKFGTAVSHQAAEDVHFVRNFIQGKIDRQLYGKMVGMLYHVYGKLEACLDDAGPEHFSQLHFPLELSRLEALAQDLDFWHGSRDDTCNDFLTPAVQDYMDRLDYLLVHDPILLLAHSYTRYLGDLSGGKILARVARRALDLGEDGLAFYEFPQVQSAKRFKDTYRNAMDALPLTKLQVVKLVAEANVAFLLNMRLFEELDVMANVPGATVRPLEQVLAYADIDVSGPVVTSAPADEAECPFMIGKMKEKSASVAATTQKTGKRCPWPFILAHDPVDGLRDWQTWAVLGLLLCWMWTRVMAGK